MFYVVFRYRTHSCCQVPYLLLLSSTVPTPVVKYRTYRCQVPYLLLLSSAVPTPVVKYRTYFCCQAECRGHWISWFVFFIPYFSQIIQTIQSWSIHVGFSPALCYRTAELLSWCGHPSLSVVIRSSCLLGYRPMN